MKTSKLMRPCAVVLILAVMLSICLPGFAAPIDCASRLSADAADHMVYGDTREL